MLADFAAARARLFGDDAGPLLRQLDDWSAEVPHVACITRLLIGAATARKQVRGDNASPALVYANELCHALNDDYQLIRKHFDNLPFEIDESKLTRYKTGDTRRVRGPLAVLFLLWLMKQQAGPRPGFEKDSLVSSILDLYDPLQDISAYVLQDRRLPTSRDGLPERQPAAPSVADVEVAVGRGIKGLLSLSHIAHPNLRRDFFADNDEASCFLLYRKSEVDDLIIKGFFVIEAPTRHEGGPYSFTHFREMTTGDFRETRGFALTMEFGHALIGGTGNGEKTAAVQVGADRMRPHLSQAFEAIVLKRDGGIHDNSIWSGLFLSHGRGFAPHSGRCALIRSRFQTYQEAQIKILKPEEIESDLLEFADPKICADMAWLGRLSKELLLVIDNSLEDDPKPGALARPLTIRPFGL